MTHIVKSLEHPGGYWINGVFVLKCNWEISKHKYTKQEQKDFEHLIQLEIELQPKKEHRILKP